jgi:hypothetical protein
LGVIFLSRSLHSRPKNIISNNVDLNLTVFISYKIINKRHARRQNKSVSRFIDDLLSSVKREAKQIQAPDEWIDKTAGSYATGKKDILNEIFKGIGK